jgi:hypothetical protein
MVNGFTVRGVIFASLQVLSACSETGFNCHTGAQKDACSGATRGSALLGSIPSLQ